MVVELEACPVCSGSSLAQKPRPTTWIGQSVFRPIAERLGLSSCADCDFVFVNPRPSEELLDTFYSTDDYDCHEHESDDNQPALRLDHVLDLLEPLQPATRTGRLLDFGCGGGYFVRRARQHGWDAIGYDIGDQARKTCQQLGLPFIDDLSSAERPFDLISLHHVFEHIADHAEFFERLDPLMDDETYLYIEVPNARSLRARLAAPSLTRRLPIDERYRAFPIHLSYFTLDNLTRLLERYGYETVSRHNFGVGLDEYFTASPLPTAKRPHRQAATTEHGAPQPEHSANDSAAAKALDRFRSRATQAFKDRIKQALWSSELGENIAVVARRAASRRLVPQAATSSSSRRAREARAATAPT